jgi:hypothetical protein
MLVAIAMSVYVHKIYALKKDGDELRLHPLPTPASVARAKLNDAMTVLNHPAYNSKSAMLLQMKTASKLIEESLNTCGDCIKRS